MDSRSGSVLPAASGTGTVLAALALEAHTTPADPLYNPVWWSFDRLSIWPNGPDPAAPAAPPD